MPHEAKIDFAKIAIGIVSRHTENGYIYGIKHDCQLKNTCAYSVLRGHSWFSGDPGRVWLHSWKSTQNTHLERFGSVPKEIELIILEHSLKEHFGDRKCANSKRNSSSNTQ